MDDKIHRSLFSPYLAWSRRDISCPSSLARRNVAMKLDNLSHSYEASMGVSRNLLQAQEVLKDCVSSPCCAAVISCGRNKWGETQVVTEQYHGIKEERLMEMHNVCQWTRQQEIEWCKRWDCSLSAQITFSRCFFLSWPTFTSTKYWHLSQLIIKSRLLEKNTSFSICHDYTWNHFVGLAMSKTLQRILISYK